MKKFLAWLLFVILVYAFQSSFMPLFYFHGIGPDLLLLVTGSVGFLTDRNKGCFAGFLFGLFEDLASGTFLGINTFTKMIIGYVCGIFSKRVLNDSFGLPVVASVLNTVFSFIVIEIIMLLLGYSFDWLAHFQFKLAPLICYNLVFAWPVHCIVRWMWNKTSDM
ncbi:MAG: rod shape-determining protein MreD [Anaerovibrio sp.]|uniref:rod shape-determining protein MreD n=1 Tax=Anaerovibrio sp. TaxID=1872532 RepID=UPI0025DC4972|nr:rod shape-determining protein MreD [Anaerovibrio sp.]MCR5175267.1 rod shape-determining protein MreD [Anaerovibrio sp.]